MKIKSSLTAIVIFILTLFIAACDVEEDGNNNSANTPLLNPGGTVAAPTQMSFDIPNEIKSVASENYFTFTASSGDAIVINTSLVLPIDGSTDLACQLTGSGFFTNLTNGYSGCIAHVRGQFGSDADRTFHFAFPNNSGYFDAAYIPAGTTFSPTSESTGRPDDPRAIILGGTDNSLSANSFYNNFIYDAQAGETLQIQTYPDVLPSGTDNLGCQTSGQTFGSPFSYGVIINTGNQFNCSETFEHYFDQAGQYNLNIRLLVGVDGFFRAVVFN